MRSAAAVFTLQTIVKNLCLNINELQGCDFELYFIFYIPNILGVQLSYTRIASLMHTSGVVLQ